MANLNLDLSGIKPLISPLISTLGLGDAPPAPKPVNVRPLPPMAPPPTPAQAGFSLWSGDPKNQQTIANSLTMPGQPITPANVPDASPLSPAPVPPPVQRMPYTPPAGMGNDMSGVQPLSALPTSAPTPAEAQQTRMRLDMTANPGEYQRPMLKNAGFVGNLLNFGAAGLIGAAGGMHGDPTAGVNWVAQQAANDRAIPAENAAQYDLRNVKPLRDAAAAQQAAAQLQDTQAQANQRQQMAPLEIAKAKAALNPKPEKPENVQALYSDAVSDAMSRGVDPSKDPKVGQLADAITALQKQPAAAKEPNKDDRAIAIYSKPVGQRTPEENAYVQGYEKYVQKNKIDPAAVRVNAMLQMPEAIEDPKNPGHVIYTTRRDSIGKTAPTDISVTNPKAITKDFTSGKDAQTLTNINTADAHSAQLQEIAKALHNGNTQVVNQLGNAYATATGSPAPLNFQLLKTALAAEIGKTTSGGVATVEETKEISKAINAANSPAQLVGVTDQARRLMGSKREQLHAQYDAGMKGTPNFGGTSAGSTAAGSSAGQAHSLSTAMALPFNKGKSADDVTKDLKARGYTVIP